MTTLFQKELEYSTTQMTHLMNDPTTHPAMREVYAQLIQVMDGFSAERDQDNIDEFSAVFAETDADIRRDQENIDEYFAERDAKNVN